MNAYCFGGSKHCGFLLWSMLVTVNKKLVTVNKKWVCEPGGSGTGQTLLQKRKRCHEEQQWLASTQPCKVSAAAIYRQAIYYQEVKDQTLCKSLRQQTFLTPMVSLWVSSWTKLSTAMSSETQLLNRRPDRKKRSKASKNKLFFQKLQF